MDAVSLQYREVAPSGTYEAEPLVIKFIVYETVVWGGNTGARTEKNALRKGMWYVSEVRCRDVCD